MQLSKKALVGFLKEEEGVTAIECALMLALVVVVCIVAINQADKTPTANDPVVVAAR